MNAHRSAPEIHRARRGFLPTLVATLSLLIATQGFARPFAPVEEEPGPDRPTLVDEGDTDAGAWKLVCPADCQLVTKTNHHGELKQYCDCDGEPGMDDGCQIWLRTRVDGEQVPICKPGCPVPEMCAEVTQNFPNGAINMHCECDTPKCGALDIGEDGEDRDEDLFD